MNIRIIVAAALAAACQPVFADLPRNSDAVSTSFARMLVHQPYPGPTVACRSAGERDPLDALVYTMFQSQRPASRLARDTYGAQIAGSFDRMLAHQTYTDPVSRSTFLSEIDPLEATIRTLLLEPGKAVLASRR
jgi:hypothetical protein